MKLTYMEETIMRTIPEQCFYEDGLDSVMWTDCFLDEVMAIAKIDQKQSRAIIVSLNKKEMLQVDGGKNGTISIMKNGRDWLIYNKVVTETGRKL